MRFEKWQALGNDYLIFEEASSSTPQRVQRAVRPALRARRRRRAGARASPTSPATSRGCGSSTPTAREAELSGNGAREAILYLRRAAGPTRDTFSIQTLAGEIRPTITGPTTCRVDMGRAAPDARRTIPDGPPDGTRRGRRLPLPARRDRQPAVRDPRRRTPTRSTCRRSARRSSTRRSSPTAPTCRSGASSRPDAIRARIFERGVGETLSSGTGACGAAVAHVLRGGDSPVTVAARRRRADRRRRRVAARRPDRLGGARSTAAS